MTPEEKLKIEEKIVTMLKTVYDPAADFLVDDARIKLESIEGINSVDIRIVFEPEWTKDMMTEEAKLDLGFL